MASRADLEKALSEASRAFKSAQWDLKIFMCDSHQSVNSQELERLQAVSDQLKTQMEEVKRRLVKFGHSTDGAAGGIRTRPSR